MSHLEVMVGIQRVLKICKSFTGLKEMIELYADMRGRKEPNSEKPVEVERVNSSSSEEEAVKTVMEREGRLELCGGKEGEDGDEVHEGQLLAAT